MRFLKISLLICTAAFLAGLWTPGTAWALLDSLLSKPPVTVPMEFPIQDENSFQAVAKSFHRIPFGDPKLEFDILLPKNWSAETATRTEDDFGLSRKILGDIARFKSPIIGTSQAKVIIQILHLDHEISAENWLKNYVAMNGYSLQEDVTPINEKRARVSFLSAFEEKSSYASAVAQINGDMVLVVRFESPLTLKEPMAFLRKRVLDSFKMILPVEGAIETQKTFVFGNAAKFSYPESWNLSSPNMKDPYNISVQLRNETDTKQLDGIIRLVAVKRSSQTSLAGEVEKLRGYFDKTLKIDFKKLVSSEKAPAYERFLFSRYEVYQIKPRTENASSQEGRLAVLGDRDWYILLFLLSPSSAENFYVWATNTQSFDMVIRSIK